MSKYTTEVRFICETGAGLVESKGFNSIDSIMEACVGNIFNFDFPIFDEAYRKVLEKKILKHYYTREICAETVGLWKHFLSTRLNEIMPYYNKLYQSELLAFNPLYDVDLTKDHTQTGSSNTEHDRSDTESHTDTRTDNLKSTSQDSGTQGDSGSDVAKNKRWDIYSDTPQGSLQNIENETYLTNARKIIDDGTGSTHSNTTTFGKKVVIDDTGTQQNNGSKSFSSEFTTGINTTEQYLEHVRGKTPGASFSKLLSEYRDTFLNIDMMIIEDLSDLFFNLW